LNPRLSLEVSDSGELRLQKITGIIQQCKYGIHDISIVRSTRVGEFARMNMPFELGVDYGLKSSGIAPWNTKQFLILEAKKYDYQKALSDISGFDIKVHSNDTEGVFNCLYTWSSETLGIHKQDPPLKLYYDFMEFNAKLFDKKLEELKNEKYALNYLESISVPEYILEIRNSLNANH